MGHHAQPTLLNSQITGIADAARWSCQHGKDYCRPPDMMLYMLNYHFHYSGQWAARCSSTKHRQSRGGKALDQIERDRFHDHQNRCVNSQRGRCCSAGLRKGIIDYKWTLYLRAGRGVAGSYILSPNKMERLVLNSSLSSLPKPNPNPISHILKIKAERPALSNSSMSLYRSTHAMQPSADQTAYCVRHGPQEIIVRLKFGLVYW